MKISTLIKKLNAIKEEHGDILIFDGDAFSLIDVNVYLKDIEDWPEDYRMPKKWVSLTTTR